MHIMQIKWGSAFKLGVTATASLNLCIYLSILTFEWKSKE